MDFQEKEKISLEVEKLNEMEKELTNIYDKETETEKPKKTKFIKRKEKEKTELSEKHNFIIDMTTRIGLFIFMDLAIIAIVLMVLLK